MQGPSMVVLHPEIALPGNLPYGVTVRATQNHERILAGGFYRSDIRLQDEGLFFQPWRYLLGNSGTGARIHPVGESRTAGNTGFDNRLLPAGFLQQYPEVR